MLSTLGYPSRAALIDAIVPAVDSRARRRCRCPPAVPEAEALAQPRGDRRQESRAEVVHRPGLLRHAHAARHPAQRARESGVVHRVHAVPAGDLAGPPRGAGQLPDDGLRPHRHGDRQRVDARRGDRRRRGDDAVRSASARARAARFFVADDVFRRRSTSCARARSRSASRSSSDPPTTAAGAGAFARAAAVSRAPTATSRDSARADRRGSTRRAASWSSRPTSSR